MTNKKFNNSNNLNFSNYHLINFILSSFVFGLFMYVIFLKYYIIIAHEIIPYGDPFTYEMGYYRILNEINNGQAITAFQRVFGGNWYWLQNFLLFIFSPILSNEPYSLCIINYLFYSLVSITLYILLVNSGIEYYLSRVLALLVWFWPINYHFSEYSALPTMGLDSTFLAALYCMTFLYLNFLIKPESIIRQILFGLFLSASLVARGNSVTVVGLLLLFPTLYFLIQLFSKKNYFQLKYFLIPALFFIVTIFTYYSLQLKKIIEYYSVFKGFLSNDFKIATIYLKNIPGIFFYYPSAEKINLINQTSYLILIITIIVHFINLFTFYKIKKNSDAKIRLIFFSGIFIFYGVFVINLLIWLNPHLTIYNSQLIWAPMRIGFVIIICCLFYSYKNFFSYLKSNILYFLFIFSAFIISSQIYSYNKTELYKYQIDSNPEKIKRIGNFIMKNSENRKGIILWYDQYLSPRIVAYYHFKENKEIFEPYRGKYADDIWNQSYNSIDFQMNVEKEINDIFLKVDFLVLNENSENYSGAPYAYYRYKNFITKQIKQGLLDNFVIVAKTKSSKGELLFFKRNVDGNMKKNFDYKFKGEDYVIKTNAKIEIF